MKRAKQQEITAIIYDKRGRVLAIGQNSYVKTHPLQAHHARKAGRPEKVFLHAEVAAIIKCKDLAKAHRIFVSRTMKNGSFGLAKPCPVCVSALEAAGIDIIEHT